MKSKLNDSMLSIVMWHELLKYVCRHGQPDFTSASLL